MYREKRINILSDNFIVAGAIKTTGKDPERGPGDPTSKSCPIGENWGIYIQSGRKRSENFRSFKLQGEKAGQGKQSQDMIAILGFSLGTSLYTANTAL